MTPCCKTEGFVFRSENRREADRLFSIFTRDFGKVEVVGKAIRKTASKLNGGIRVFSVSELEFVQGKNRKILTDAVFLQKFGDIAANPEKFAVACEMSNIVNEFIKGEEKDEAIFNLLNDLFNKLNKYQPKINNYQLIYNYFFWNFIAIAGHCPEFLKCVICRNILNPRGIYFSSHLGGLICNGCFSKSNGGVKIESGAIKIIRLILKNDWSTLLRLKTGTIPWGNLKEVSENYQLYLRSHYSSNNEANGTVIL